MPASNEEFIKKAFESGLTEDKVRAAVTERNKRTGIASVRQEPSLMEKIKGLPIKVAKFTLPAITSIAQDVGASRAVNSPEFQALQQSTQAGQQQAQALIARATKETDPVKKAKFLEIARSLNNQQNGINVDKEGWFSNQVDQNALRRGLNVGAEVGSYAVPFGKGANVITKAALPGAAVGGLRSLSEGGDMGDIAAGAGLGAAGATTLYGVGKGAKWALDQGKTLIKGGDKLIQSQFNLPRSTANSVRLPETVDKLREYGITNINDIEAVASKVTGNDGVITKITRDAVSKAKPVNTEGILQIAQDLADDPSIAIGKDKKFVEFIKKGVQKLYNTKGAAAESQLGNPLETFNLIQKLEKQAAGITKGRLPNMVSAEDNALAGAFRSMADELRGRLFQQAGADDMVVKISQNYIRELEQISPKLASDVAKATTIQQLRSIASPFVRGSIAADVTQTGQNLATENLGGMARGVGRLVQNPLNILAMPLSSNSVNSWTGKSLANIGDLLSTLGTKSQKLATPGVKNVAGQMSGRFGALIRALQSEK